MKAKKLDLQTQEQILKVYGTKAAKEIAQDFGCTLDQVYEVARRNGRQQKQNQQVEITNTIHQILLGGFLGDGRFKKNGQKNAIYSECHALGEKDYLKWKFENLGDLTSKTVIYPKNANNGFVDAVEFTTLTTPSLTPYLDYDKTKAISELDELGLLIHLLDDGWFAPSGKEGRFCVCVSNWSDSERELLVSKWKEVFGIDASVYGIKRKDIGFTKKDNPIILKAFFKYFPIELDILQKKCRIILQSKV